MGMTFNGANVQIDGNVTTEFTKYEPGVIAYGSTGTGGTLGTVPAGKKWSIIYAFASMPSTANTMDVNLYDGVTNRSILKVMGATGVYAFQEASFDYAQAPVLAEGDTVVWSAGGSAQKRIVVWYIEEDA